MACDLPKAGRYRGVPAGSALFAGADPSAGRVNLRETAEFCI